ncbi:MAG TPA: helicase [Leptospiraceae bacterium]|nr:helicase [Leptospiraceae bacterium]HMW07854.1 helicase [Leptospiraceae bacterium]HMX32340.1 helicase [Leptospiraceae bacterium]HMY32659.1 helicase [Leptospiraceae bacterium]HMZ66918.1 helicase [Leptospiraceae bacterium]
MDKENILIQELGKLELPELKKVATLWNIHKFTGKDKKSSVSQLYSAFQEEFYLKAILEKLTPIQVNIFSLILKNKNVQTLGEIVRKTSLHPINAETELGVLRKYCLVYQRKNRERLTNNLDKYHAYSEIADLIKLDINAKGEKFKLSLDKYFHKHPVDQIAPEWIKVLGYKKIDSLDEFVKFGLSEEGIGMTIQSLSEIERDVLLYVYTHGGVIEAEVVRNYISVNREKFEHVIPLLTSKYLVFDTYYVDEKFIRIITIPKEILNYIQVHTLLPSAKKGTKQKQEKIAKNDLDFFLNIKKMISFISRKGLSLAKSGKIKQADNKRTEQDLLKPDIDIFPEKGQVYQIELILPILKILNLVDIKGENIVLTGEIDEFQKKDIFELMNIVIHEVNEVRSKRFNPPEVFSAIEVPFYDKPILDKCVNIILSMGKVNTSVIFSNVIRENLVLSPGFRIKNFENDLMDLRKEIISAIFYLHLFGLLEVEYPSRYLVLSDLGKYYFQSKAIPKHTEKGGITINSDFSIIAFPEKCSLHGIHLLKVFTELKDYDRVYTFALTKDSFQNGILLGYDPNLFIQFLKDSSKAELAQNLMFLFDDWSKNLPIVVVTEDCVLLKTYDVHVMELLLGQIKGKKIVMEEISPEAILIDKTKIQDVIQIAEKLNLIIKLIR